MPNTSNDTIDDVAPGDIVTVARGTGEPQPYKVVHKDADAGTYVVTFEQDDGETFQEQFPAGTRVTRSLEAKRESGQSPTPHNPDAV